MKTKSLPELRTVLCLALLSTMMGCAQKEAVKHAEASASATTEPAPLIFPKPEAAQDVLMRMAEFLAKTPRFTVHLDENYDVVQASGQQIEFGERRQISVNRPNGLRSEVEQSNGDKHVITYDGKEITVFNPSRNVYAQIAKPGGIDAAVMYFLKDLKMRLPLAMLVVSRLPEELKQRTQSLEYVEGTFIDGKPVHHLAGRTETVDYQVWVDAGAQPLPLRVVLTYKHSEGQPEFRSQFIDWNLSPEMNESQFTFTPPEGARKIAFLAELPRIALGGTANPKQTGEQK